MPLPTPDKNESMNKFISRCMGDPRAKKEVPDRGRRVDVCRSQYTKKSKVED